MSIDLKMLDTGLEHVSKALHTAAENARDPVVRNVAKQHLGLVQYYRDGLLTGNILVTSDFGIPEFNEMIRFSDRAVILAERRQWRSVLIDSHALIMALPGDPPSLPIVPPRPLGRRKP